MSTIPEKVKAFFYSTVKKEHFQLVKVEESEGGGYKTTANCLLCATPKPFHGDTKSNGNFLKHIKSQHDAVHGEFYAEPGPRRKRGKPNDDNQTNLEPYRTGFTSGKQRQVDQAIIEYIVGGMKPLSTVACPYFQNLIKAAADDPKKKDNAVTVTVMDRKTVSLRISTMFDNCIKKTKGRLQNAAFVCLTADMWSSHRRSFIGTTCHWLEEDSQEGLTRRSAILACSRFRGPQTYDKVAEKILGIMARFDIPLRKVVYIVTDNGSNFVKAFKEFGMDSALTECIGIQFQDPAQGGDDESDEDDEDFQMDDMDGEEDNDPTVTIQNIGEILEHEPPQRVLPPHLRCASHTLSLFVTSDFLKISDRRLYNSAMGKCVKLWNLSSQPKSNEMIEKICGRILKTPGKTRWNSLYDSLGCLLQLDKLGQVFDALHVARLTEKELEFLNEYQLVTKPVAVALDKLQGEKNIFLGDLLPILRTVKRNVESAKSSLKLATSFATKIIDSLEKRFLSVMAVDLQNPSDFVVSAICHPFHKLRWIDHESHSPLIVKLRELCLATAREDGLMAGSPDYSMPAVDNFFGYDETPPVASLEEKIRMETLGYFDNPDQSLKMLDLYPNVKKVFVKFNTALPTSAPVEREFSYAGLILTPRRCNIKDDLFEKLVMLKCNKNILTK